jgi:hypothetical protein
LGVFLTDLTFIDGRLDDSVLYSQRF